MLDLFLILLIIVKTPADGSIPTIPVQVVEPMHQLNVFTIFTDYGNMLQTILLDAQWYISTVNQWDRPSLSNVTVTKNVRSILVS